MCPRRANEALILAETPCQRKFPRFFTFVLPEAPFRSFFDMLIEGRLIRNEQLEDTSREVKPTLMRNCFPYG